MENQPTENIDIPPQTPPDLPSPPLQPLPEAVERSWALLTFDFFQGPVQVLQGPVELLPVRVRVPYVALPEAVERLTRSMMPLWPWMLELTQSETMQAPAAGYSVPLTPLGTLPLQAIVVEPSAAIRIFNICKPFFERVGIAINTAAAGFSHLWDRYYQGMALGEANIRSDLEFTIGSQFAMVQLKGQGIPGFPFQTHPKTIIFTAIGILVYVSASAAQFVISAAGVDRASAYAIITHLVRMGSFIILVGSLASLLLHNQ